MSRIYAVRQSGFRIRCEEGMFDRATIEDLLKRKIGLDILSIGPATLDGAIRRRMNAAGTSDEFQYLSLVRTSEEELNELVEEVIVPETWFFRNEHAFQLLGSYARQWFHASSRKDKLRILSVPCSTGEEPYSIAMTFIQMGLPAHAYRIDAVDISKKTLQRAKRAIYGKNSFRGQNLSFRNTFFQSVGEDFHLLPAVCEKVRFRRDNLLKSDHLHLQESYEVIFCRNLFIYLEESARRKIIELLRNLLIDHGLLFVGPAETGRILGAGFEPAPPVKAFAYRKIDT